MHLAASLGRLARWLPAHADHRIASAIPSMLAWAGAGSARTASASAGQEAQLPIQGGTLVEVHSLNSPVDFKAQSGGETATLQFNRANAWTWATRSADDGRDVIELRDQPSSAGSPLTVAIPDKWIGVHVDSKGHPVSVAKVNEANLHIHSHGGDVTLGQIRAYNASVSTLAAKRCGMLKGGELSGCDVSVMTGHAPIELKRLVGQRIHVSLHDRPLDVGSLYAESVTIHTGGGDISITNLDCSDEADLHTEGGQVNVDSLDGNADLHTNGGDVEVHLHSKVGMVRIASGGGNVRVAVSPQAYVEVEVRHCGKVTCHDADQEVDRRTGGKMWHFRPQGESNKRYGQLSEGRVIVDAGHGSVEITRVGWMEALKQRLQQQAMVK